MALVILQQLIRFAIMAGIGFLAVKIKVLNETGLAGISSLVVKITMPLMILTNILDGADRQQLISCAVIIPATIGLVLFLFGLAVLISKLCRLKGNEKRIFRACGTLGNNGFMGIPLAVALFPQMGALYSAVLTLVDQTACWSLGYYLCLPEEKLAGSRWTANLKKILNPCIIAVVLAIVMVLLGWHLPSLLQGTLSTVGSVTSPLAMIYIGGLVAGLNFKKAFTRVEFYLLTAGKLLAAPIVTYLVLTALHIDSEIVLYMTMIAGTPVMSSVCMIAKSTGSDGDYAAGAVLVTTILCIGTLPLVMLITGLL